MARRKISQLWWKSSVNGTSSPLTRASMRRAYMALLKTKPVLWSWEHELINNQLCKLIVEVWKKNEKKK